MASKRDVLADILGSDSKVDTAKAAVLDKVRNAKSPAEQAAERKAAKAVKPAKGKAVKAKDAKPAKGKAVKAKDAKPAKGKAVKAKDAKPKPAKKGDKAKGERMAFDDKAKITVVGEFAPRDGSGSATAFALLCKSKTVGAYRAAREKQKMPGLGGLLGNLVRQGVVRVA